jgi:hypothetical protein
MYAAFGNKQDLFRKVLDRYAETADHYVNQGLQAPTAREAVERMLLASAEALGDAKKPRGCLLVQGALACGHASTAVQRELCSRRSAGEAAYGSGSGAQSLKEIYGRTRNQRTLQVI